MILAFDTASENTGIAARMSDGSVLPGATESEATLWWTSINVHSPHIESRVGEIFVQARALIAAWLLRAQAAELPMVLVLEQARRGRYQAVYAALRCAQAALWCTAYEYDLPLRYVTPVQWRVAIGLAPKSTKAQACARIKLLNPELHDQLLTATEDEIDAVAIATAFSLGYSTTRKVRKV